MRRFAAVECCPGYDLPPLPESDAMIGATLHEYDLWLSHYVIGNIRQYMGEPRFAAWVVEGLGPGPLLSYLQEEGVAPGTEQEWLLLNDDELEDLATIFLIGEPEHDREWMPYEVLHARYIETLREIRDRLSTQATEGWSDVCVQFARQLEGGRVRLAAGIETVHDWVRCLRRFLRAMGAITLLPRPDGPAPTPTTAASPAATQCVPLDDKELDANNRMRTAIREVPNGREAKAKTLVTHAKIHPTTGRNALRRLQAEGEYEGFARDRPHCFRMPGQ